MPRIGVVLSGCGYLDGAEVHEAVFTLANLDKAGADIVIMAPDMEQMHVVNHITGQPQEGEKRNVLVEAARIARGNIRNIAEVKGDDIDALMFPGGFGAAKNLSDFAVKGDKATVHPEVARLVREVHQAGKWITAVCIAPVIVAKVLEESGVKNAKLTLGAESEFADKLRGMGAEHVECPVKEARVDTRNRVITSPAFMYEARFSEVAAGVELAVKNLMAAVAGQPVPV